MVVIRKAKEMLTTKQFNDSVNNILKRKKAALYALALNYAAKALNYFRRQQASEVYWKNQTFQAMDEMTTGAIREKDVIGWFMAHGVEYGPRLELANNGQNEAIKPVIDHFKDDFFEK